MRARLIIALLGAASVAPLSTAQMRAPSNFPVALGRTISFKQPARPHSSNTIFLGDPFYSDYPAEPFAVQTAPPQVVLVQPAPAHELPETKAEPLLIELQGDHYVRFGGSQQSANRGINVSPDYAEVPKPPQPAIPQELPPAVLVFRDGHREQVREYAIVAGVLYANENYWQNGHRARNIQLSALNLPATFKANRDIGVKFTLPSAPNEVITRP